MKKNEISICADILDKIVSGGYSNLILKDELAKTEKSRRAFINANISFALEHLIELDYLIDSYKDKVRVRPKIRNILRIATARLKYMKSEDYATVNESVEAAKAQDQRIAGGVNRILREMIRQGFEYPMSKDELKEKSIRYSFPEWLIKRIENDVDDAQEFLSYKPEDNFSYGWKSPFKEAAKEYESVPGAKHAIKIYGDIIDNEDFSSGAISVMGLASMKALNAVYDGEKNILDVCAAPGGKSAYAYILSGGEAEIEACDIYEHRVEVMNKNFERLNVKAKTFVRDASATEYEDIYDLVIVDAPCSALGLIHKKPDIRYNRNEQDIAALAEISKKILAKSAKAVKKGGTLAFFTCTILKEENEETVFDFLGNNSDFYLERLDIPEENEGYHTFMPMADGEGFFACRMKRKK